MSPITKIAMRRIKNDLHMSIFLMIAVFFSMMLISFFVFFEIQTVITQNPAYKDLPFTSFMIDVRTCMNIIIVFLVLITSITIRIHCGIRSEGNEQALAVLTSVGATWAQKRKLILADIMLLYLPPTVLGVFAGIIPGIKTGYLFHGGSGRAVKETFIYITVAFAILTFAFVLILLCNFLPNIHFRRRSVIQAVKKQNEKANEQRHGYRLSQTYRNSDLLKRLARKSIDYYSRTYNGIALIFAASALYPVLAILFIWNIGFSEIVIDSNPYDAFKTSGAVVDIVEGMLLFLCVCFLVLTVVGLIQAVIISRIQAGARKRSAHVYLSVGMPKDDINKMIGKELQSVIIRAVLILLCGILLANACFVMALGA